MLLLILTWGVETITPLLEFTLHFATINTLREMNEYEQIVAFTLHFATINTFLFQGIFNIYLRFTLHFATINTISKSTL